MAIQPNERIPYLPGTRRRRADLTLWRLRLDNPPMALPKKSSPAAKNLRGTPAAASPPPPIKAAPPLADEAGKTKKRKLAVAEPQVEAPKRRGRPRKDLELRQVEARPEEMQRAISLLDELVQAFGGSRRHVDKMLGTGRSRTSQILSGRLELKFQHILDVLEVLGIESRAFFEVLYGEEEHAPFPAPLAVVYRQKLRAMGGGAPATFEAIAPKPPEAPAIPHFLTEEEVRQLIDHRLFEAFSQVMPKKPAKGGAPDSE
jgi:antitoxin component HigA of HigAB toxin-antitoxin module